MRPPAWLVVVLVGALAGLVFAGVSTYDFVQHLDRQVHDLHCSFIPGGGGDAGANGCQVAMMSPYSSVLRTSIWGGIPISLPAMAVFAFILFYAADLVVTRRKDDVRATAFLVLATALPALASLTMLIVSLTKLGTTCKLCVGIYVASALCLTGAITLWRRAVALRGTLPERAPARAPAPERSEPAFASAKEPAFAATVPAFASSTDGRAQLEIQVDAPATSNGFLAAMFGTGVLFVAIPIALYVAMAPDHGRFVGTCGELAKPEDTYGVMVPLHRGGRAQALEILDPLCPACKAFEARLEASGFADQLDRKAILFPLDTTCNWMITENTHPGACTISEAVLCAGERAPAVLAWSFEAQAQIRAETAKDPAAAARIVKARFPDLAACVGSPEAKSRLNKSLRWAVANNIRVLTPQLFVNGVKLCDEDVDLGLDYALAKMLDGDMPARPQLAKPVEATPPAPTGTAPTPTAPAATAPAAPTATAPAPTQAPPAADEPSTGAITSPGDVKPATAEPAPAAPAASDKPVAEPASEPSAPSEPAADKPAAPAEPPAEPTPEPAAPAAEPAGGNS